MNLTEIKTAVEKKYASLPVTWEDENGTEKTLVLRNILRLGEKEQMEVQEFIQSISGSADDISTIRATLKSFLAKLSGNPKLAAEFVKVIGDDLAVMTYVVDEYMKVTQAEKASAS